MKRYLKSESSRVRKETKETNDCSVIATSIVCRTSYKDAHEICRIHGRKPRCGIYEDQILEGVKALGFDVVPVKNLLQKNGSQYTPKTIGNKLKRGYYICMTHGHVFAVVNGDVEDWAHDRRHRIYAAYKVIRKRD
jgi:hypothetical protein